MKQNTSSSGKRILSAVIRLEISPPSFYAIWKANQVCARKYGKFVKLTPETKKKVCEIKLLGSRKQVMLNDKRTKWLNTACFIFGRGFRNNLLIAKGVIVLNIWPH